MFPLKFLQNTSTYNLSLNEVKITAKVVERNSMELKEVDISELRSRLDPSYPIVGFDLKYTTAEDSKEGESSIVILVFYVRDYCLLVQFDTKFRNFNDVLFKFMTDSSICFLGWGDKELLDKVAVVKGSKCFSLTFVSVSTLAVRVLRRKDVIDGCCNLEDLATKVGVPFFPVQSTKKITGYHYNQKFMFYTEEELKFAIGEAFNCYNIGTHLMKGISYKRMKFY